MNKLTKNKHLEIATKYCDIIEVEYQYEGKDIITDEILDEIDGYSYKDLTTQVMVIIAKAKV